MEGCPKTLQWLFVNLHLLKDVMEMHLPSGAHYVLAHRVQVSPTSGAIIVIPHWGVRVTAAMVKARDAVFSAVPFLLRRDLSWASVSLHSQMHPTFALQHTTAEQVEMLMRVLAAWNVHCWEQGTVQMLMW